MGPWPHLMIPEPAAVILHFAYEPEADIDPLAEPVVMETGLPLAESRGTLAMIIVCEYYACLADDFYRDASELLYRGRAFHLRRDRTAAGAGRLEDLADLARDASAAQQEHQQSGLPRGTQMERPLTSVGHEVIKDDERLVHAWRVMQLTGLGIPWSLAQAVADHVDWHQVANLARHGCPPRLALRIVR